MNKILISGLKVLRKVYTKIVKPEQLLKPDCEENPNLVSQIIFETLTEEKPCMIGRFGAFELTTMINYLGVQRQDRNILKFVKGESLQWWWNQKTLFHMQNNAGFFPPTEKKIAQFCELMLQDMKRVDILGSWVANEHYFMNELKGVTFVQREVQNPYFANLPWTKALEGKKVLVVHPFADLIEHQYSNKREKLFTNPDILPEFNLKAIKAVQSLGGQHETFKDWFEALQWMKDEIDQQDYDICLIGCGAYGFPLAAHVKRQGKKAVHLGGSLQLLFGIKGKRWENPNYNKSIITLP